YSLPVERGAKPASLQRSGFIVNNDEASQPGDT
ncbi:MAG: hypothetical protein ACI9BC_001268, partial [Crocinitomicaceae bacterium]